VDPVAAPCERARRTYEQRVAELEDQLDEAERLRDHGRASRAREELEAVAEQLASAVGLGGRISASAQLEP
jgi:50S ribosomal subunit-associated GTPase HflX